MYTKAELLCLLAALAAPSFAAPNPVPTVIPPPAQAATPPGVVSYPGYYSCNTVPKPASLPPTGGVSTVPLCTNIGAQPGNYSLEVSFGYSTTSTPNGPYQYVQFLTAPNCLNGTAGEDHLAYSNQGGGLQPPTFTGCFNMDGVQYASAYFYNDPSQAMASPHVPINGPNLGLDDLTGGLPPARVGGFSTGLPLATSTPVPGSNPVPGSS